MDNIKKNVKILICKGCGKKHVIDKDMLNYSFRCEDCKNEIFVDETGVQIVIGNLEPAVVNDADNEGSNLSVKKEDVKESIKTDETNEFTLI